MKRIVSLIAALLLTGCIHSPERQKIGPIDGTITNVSADAKISFMADDGTVFFLNCGQYGFTFWKGERLRTEILLPTTDSWKGSVNDFCTDFVSAKRIP